MPPEIETWQQGTKTFNVFERVGDRARGILCDAWVDVDANCWRKQLGMEQAKCVFQSEEKTTLQ